MKFTIAAISALLLSNGGSAFVAPQRRATSSRTSSLNMALDMPPAEPTASEPAVAIKQSSDLPVIKQSSMGQPSDIRYSDFLKLVNADKIEKVTFSADGQQLLGVDVDGDRLKIQALPNDPNLLNQLTTHKVSRNQLKTS